MGKGETPEPGLSSPRRWGTRWGWSPWGRGACGGYGLRPVSDGHCLCLVSRESTLKDGEAIVRDQLVSLFERITGRRVPRRVIGFAPVGLSGTVVHDGLFLILRTWGWSFLHSRSVAIAAEASSSYRVNNRLTFRYDEAYDIHCTLPAKKEVQAHGGSEFDTYGVSVLHVLCNFFRALV